MKTFFIKLHLSFSIIIATVFLISTPLSAQEACPELIWEGDYEIRTAEDLAGLSGYTSIKGSLYIHDSDLISIAGLECLDYVWFLDIEHNDRLTSLKGLESLTRIGGALHIINNDSLKNFEGFENLAYTLYEDLPIYIADNDALESVDGMGPIWIFSLYLENNKSLSSIKGFKNVLAYTVYLSIVNNDSLINLEGLEQVGVLDGMSIRDNDSLKSLRGLDNLIYVDFSVSIANNDSLLNLDGLDSLGVVETLSITDNDSLLNLGGLNGVYPEPGADRISIWNLLIQNNNSLQNFSGLSNLYSIPGTFNIDNNNSLSSFYGLDNFTAVSSLYVTNNQNLCTSDAEDFGDQLTGIPISGDGFTGKNIFISGNKDCTPYIIDNCPNDPNKSEPGLCGCGVPDTDEDLDGTPDCQDNCPSDPNKTAQGLCGCGIADIDTDLDGTLDCNDNCPNDLNKTQPGTCGCGNAENDTDLDGTPDCIDNCPNDINKIQPDICGCGIADADSDGDGIPDCNDNCNNLIDSDGDGVNDCDDLCPNDPNKARPGTCGCGITDNDSDGDGTFDCKDTNDDGDGLSDGEEQGPDRNNPNYDGNGDGTADHLQGNVASFHIFKGQNYVTIESPDGTLLGNCKVEDNPSKSNAPSDVEFSFGFFSFSIDKVSLGGASTATLHSPAGPAFNTYYKYGPTPENPINHWYEFLYDGQTGAEINGNMITLHFVDGSRGDDDLTANGTISDIGGPGLFVDSVDNGIDNSQVIRSSGGGGGCFISAANLGF